MILIKKKTLKKRNNEMITQYLTGATVVVTLRSFHGKLNKNQTSVQLFK
jgi:hypothetical protein